ncbi:hypothetical protein [Pseudobutyrivibrio sp.]
MKGLGLCGFVANSTYTVEGDTMSAVSLYDKIGTKVKAKVVYVLPNRAVCKVIKEKKDSKEVMRTVLHDLSLFSRM